MSPPLNLHTAAVYVALRNFSVFFTLTQPYFSSQIFLFYENAIHKEARLTWKLSRVLVIIAPASLNFLVLDFLKA